LYVFLLQKKPSEILSLLPKLTNINAANTYVLVFKFLYFRKSGIRDIMQNFHFLFCRVKNCQHTNLVYLGKSASHHGQNYPAFRYRYTEFVRVQFFTRPNQEYKLYIMSLIQKRVHLFWQT